MSETFASPVMRRKTEDSDASTGAARSSCHKIVATHDSLSFSEDRCLDFIDNRRVFVAVSPAMREVRRQIEQVAGIDAGVLLLGESGSGKEVVAQMIHKLSRRASRKFLKVNCAALPVDLLESELFGYEAGAFTGARQAKAGKFEVCHQGTLLLDEIGEMPIAPQAKLLHALQDGEFLRLGSNSSMRVDVRVLAATNVDVQGAMQAGTFRADLYYRLNVLTIHVPPLRERKEDMPNLLHHMMAIWSASYARPPLPVTHRMLEACASYPWPGNVRELESFVKRCLVFGDERLALQQLEGGSQDEPALRSTPDGTEHNPAAPGATSASGSGDLKDIVNGLKQQTECAAILHALEQNGGCKKLAAYRLGISLRALHYKIRRYGIIQHYDASQPAWFAAASRERNHERGRSPDTALKSVKPENSRGYGIQA